ncbi:MFS transporter [Micromonospora sp. NPDC049230]|uniref:MFS transporter n=1 Tax=Micromonospora sp. NPDC049230 TaxID=3155502 RepID=UPI0033D2B67E
MPDRFEALRDRSFRLLFASRTVSALGNAVAPVALAFAVLSLPGATATTLGLVLLGRSVAQVVFLIVAGVVADRLPRYAVMMTAELLAGTTQVIVAILFLTDSVHLGVVVGLEVLNGASLAFLMPASAGLVPQLVKTPHLQSANALLRISVNFSNIVGAAIAGVLVATVGPGWALLVDAASFFLSAALLAGVSVAHTLRAERSTMLEDLRHGWHEFSSRQWVWVIVVAAAVVNACFTGGFNVLGPIVAKQYIGGAAAWAAIAAALSAGLLVGSFVALRMRPVYPMRTVVVAAFGFCLPLFLLAGPAQLWIIVAAAFCMGICADISGVFWDTGLQTHIPQESLSRVSAYDMLGSLALGPVGLAVAGPIADAIGVRETLIGAGGLIVLSCLAALLSAQVRNLRRSPPARQQ